MPEGTFSQYAGLFACLLLIHPPKINGFVCQYSHLVDFEGLKSVQDKPWGHWKLNSPWKGYRTVGDYREKQATITQAMLNPKWQCPGDIKARGVPAGLALEFHNAFHGNLSSVSVHVPLNSCSFQKTSSGKDLWVWFLTTGTGSSGRSTPLSPLPDLHSLHPDPTDKIKNFMLLLLMATKMFSVLVPNSLTESIFYFLCQVRNCFPHQCNLCVSTTLEFQAFLK